MGLLALIKSKLTEAEMRQGCTDQTPHAEIFLNEILSKITEVVEGARLKMKRGGILSDREARYYNRGAGTQANAILRAIKENTNENH